MRRLLRSFRFMLGSLFGRDRKQDELDEEFQSHLEMKIEDLELSGMPREEAVREARKLFGKIDLLKEETRDTWGTRVVVDLIRDIRYSARSLWKDKGFSIGVISTLALCIGMNSTILSSLYHLVLKPLPFEDAERIVRIYNYDNRVESEFPIVPLYDGRTDQPYSLFPTGLSSVGQYFDYNEKANLFEGFSIIKSQLLNVYEGGTFRQIHGLNVGYDLFDLLSVKPLIGRFFTKEESHRGNHRVIVLSEAFWKSHYNAEPSVIGKLIQLENEASYTIIGVAPKVMNEFEYGAKYFTPFVIYDEGGKRATTGGMTYMAGRLWIADLWGKLKEGASLTAAENQLQWIENEVIQREALLEDATKDNLKVNHLVSIGHRPEIGRPTPMKTPLFLLQAGAIFVFLIGYVNVINLILSRTSSKIGELSVRHALGAGRVALCRLLTVESLVLCGLAVVLGVLMTFGGLKLGNGYLTVIDPQSSPIALDYKILIVALSASLILAHFMGVTPYFALWRANKIQRIESGIRSATSGKTVKVFNDLLVIFQVAATFILIVGAGLLFRSFSKVLHVDPGFSPEQVIQARIHILNYDNYRKTKGAILSLRDKMVGSVKDISGISNVSAVGMDPLDLNYTYTLMIEGIDYTLNDDPLPTAMLMAANESFFDSMGIRFVEGTTFPKMANVDPDQRYFILDKGVVERYYGDKPAVGSTIYSVRGTGSRTIDTNHSGSEVIGVVESAAFAGLQKRDALPIIYLDSSRGMGRDVDLYIRTNRTIDSLGAELRKALSEVSENIVVNEIQSVKVLLDEKHLDRQGATYLIGCFSGIALFLSGIGLYSLIAYSVVKRKREIGIRQAIGATFRSVLNMIVRQGMMLVGIGLGIGFLGAVVVSRFLESHLFEVSPFDWISYLAAFLFFIILGVSATLFPALRAIQISPMETLRLEE